MLPSELPPPPTHGDFGKFLAECMRRGIRPRPTDKRRPTDKDFGEEWETKEFAGAIKRTTKTLDNYLKNESLPRKTGHIETALFGPDQSYLEPWRLALQDALQRTREKLAESSSEDEGSSEEIEISEAPETTAVPETPSHQSDVLRILRENGPTIVGGIGIAQGVAHLIWLLTEFLSGNPENLWEKHWAYADLGFGIGGIIIGFGCIAVRPSARKSGICFCVAALFAAYLWFADETNSDAGRLLWAANALNVPVSLGALCYFLFGWPEVISQNSPDC